jgi:hypothetical protein
VDYFGTQWLQCHHEYPVYPDRKATRSTSRSRQRVSSIFCVNHEHTPDKFCRKQSFPQNAGTSNIIILSQKIAACPGQSYTLTGWAGEVISGTFTGNCFAKICADGGCGSEAPLTTTTYSQFSYHFTASTSPVTVSVVTYCTSSKSASVYVDSISVA